MERRTTQGDRVRPRVALRTQGGASLYPGLSHFAPLGRGDDGPSYEVRWRFEPTRWTGSAGSLNETRWSYAPTGRKGIAQGKAKRRPGIRYARTFASPERAEPAVRKSMRTCFALSGLWRIGAAAYLGRSRTTQGGASLYPGLSHYAPLGRTIRLRIGVDCTLQATQVVVGYSRWRLLDGPTPQRGAG